MNSIRLYHSKTPCKGTSFLNSSSGSGGQVPLPLLKLVKKDGCHAVPQVTRAIVSTRGQISGSAIEQKMFLKGGSKMNAESKEFDCIKIDFIKWQVGGRPKQ